MVAPPARSHDDYDYLINKLLLISDSGDCLDLHASSEPGS
jgi:hypothetical protein